MSNRKSETDCGILSGDVRTGRRRLLKAAALFCLLLLFMTGSGKDSGWAVMKVQAGQMSWQDAFISVAQEALNTASDPYYYLVRLDGDDIPEMIIHYGSVAESEEIFIWNQDRLLSWMFEYYSFSYIPRTGQLRIGGGRQGIYTDELYQYQDGKFYLLSTGRYEQAGDSLERDAYGNFLMNDQFRYFWNDQEVSADEYVSSRRAVFDISLAVSPYTPPCVTYNFEGLRQALQDGSWESSLQESPNMGGEAAREGEGTSGQSQDGGSSSGPAQAYMEFVSGDAAEYPGMRLYFEYTDEYGNPLALTNLEGTVTESINGGADIERAVRKIQRLEGNQGLSIDIVADKSGSMEYDLPVMQQIMSDFVRSLDYASGDQVEILTFDDYIMYMCTYTRDVSLLLNGISNMTAYGGTALYDALYTGVMNASRQAGARCVIGFTDGEDNMSLGSADSVIALSNQTDVPVYLIGTSGADSYTLTYIAEQTGGCYWSVNSINDVGDILREIYSNQKDMYCIEYESDPNVDPYARRRVTCTLSGDGYTGRADNVEFEAAQVIRQTPHASRYEMIHADVTWQQANDACIARGGHLVTIADQGEMDILVNMCEAEGVKYCWIGGYTSVKNGSAFGHWITGEPFNFTAWYPGEPSRQDKDGEDEFYLMLWKVEDAWSWNDQRNDVLHIEGLDYFTGKVGYICEYES